MQETVNTKKKKILIVHNYYQIAGGEDTVVAYEKKLLEDHGNEVVLYTRDNKEINGMNRLQKLGLFFTTIYNPKTARDIEKIIKNENIDIVHVHNTLNLISPAVYYAATKTGRPVVQTVHNYRLVCPGALLYRDGKLCEDCLHKDLKCSLKHRCYRNSFLQTFTCYISAVIHRMSGIYKKINYICLTEFGRDKLLEAKGSIFNSDRMFIKPNFMNNAEGSIKKAEDRRKQIVFAGRLDKSKGIDLLLKAWKINCIEDGINLVIFGDGPEKEWCQKYISDNNLANVSLCGKVDHDKIMEIMSESFASILPTRWYEGFPMSIAESLSVGTPVIGPDMGNVGAIIEEGVNGHKYAACAESDIDEDKLAENIADAIKKCIEQQVSESGKSIYIKAHDSFLQNYRAESNYERLMEIYNQIS